MAVDRILETAIEFIIIIYFQIVNYPSSVKRVRLSIEQNLAK